MKFTFTPEKLRKKRPYDSPEYDELVTRARQCLLWRMSPAYWDSMSPMEHHAWIEAWNSMQEEQEGR